MKINAPGGNAAQVADRGRSGSFTLRSVCQSGNKGKCQNVRDRVATFITKLGGGLMYPSMFTSLEIGNQSEETNHACALQPKLFYWFSERLA